MADKTLNDIMEFEHVIEVHEDGTITDRNDLYAPSLLDGELDSSEWTMLSGFSGQDRYSGPIMHNSEYIGGGMEAYIRETPGVYVVVVSDYSPTCDKCEADVHMEPSDLEDESKPWVLMHDNPFTTCGDAEGSDELYSEGWAVCILNGSQS